MSVLDVVVERCDGFKHGRTLLTGVTPHLLVPTVIRLVFLHVGLVPETLMTVWALEGRDAHVLVHVTDVVGLGATVEVAHAAHVDVAALFLVHNLHVLTESGPGRVDLGTLLTVEPLPHVLDAHVHLQISQIRKGFLTLVTT